jgi:hypothetical protein
MASLLIVLTNPQRPPQPLTLLNLRLGHLMNLMALQPLLPSRTSIPLLLCFQFLAQRIALVVDGVFVQASFFFKFIP